MLTRTEVSLSTAQTNNLSDFFSSLNARFFAGTAASAADEIRQSEAWREFIEGDYGFLSGYSQSILADPSPENNRVTVGFQKHLLQYLWV